MKKIYLLLAFLSIHLAQSQLIVNNSTFTPAQLVQNVLLGGGVTVSNITFNGSAAAANTIQDKVGRFSNGNTTNIGLTNGIILATGNAQVAVGPNDDTNDSQPSTISAGDPDLDLLTTNTIDNKTIIEALYDSIGYNANQNNLRFYENNYRDELATALMNQKNEAKKNIFTPIMIFSDKALGFKIIFKKNYITMRE